MHSMDFEEFLWAKGYDRTATGEMLWHMENEQLLDDYKEDIRKYADGMDQPRILNVFEQIPVQLAKDNKKFQISK